ncbi:CYTH domain-containing protein [Marinobacter sp.]|uniref:CYTH domain-containing protein n=1 Tax=Marinobacter sp. TaxID=50741 RepID=UPI003A91B905
MATELEIKLSVSEAAQGQALKWLSDCSAARVGNRGALVNRYYDTPDAELNRAKAALRIRKAGDAYIQTLKTRGEFVDGAHCRQEWEWPLSGPELDLSLLEDTPLRNTLDLKKLQVVFETNFQRQVLWLEDGQSLIEVAVDSGSIVAGKARWPLHEVEFELKSGEGGKLVEWALALAREVPVFLNLVSKAEQGYFLAGIYHPEATRAGVPISVTGFLQALSVGWLLDQPFAVKDYDLARVTRAADAAGCRELWHQVSAELARGAPVRDLANGAKELGVLQLQLAATGSG